MIHALINTSHASRLGVGFSLALLLGVAACEDSATASPADRIAEGELAEGELAAGSGSSMGIGGITGGMGADKVDPRVGKAENLIAAGEAARALKMMDEAIAEDDENGRFHYVRGNALSHLDRDDDALAAYQRAVELDERDFMAHAAIGSMTAHGRGDREGAIAHYQKALHIAPEFGPAHHGLGVVLFQLGRSKQAIQALENAARLMPNSPDVVFVLSQARAQAGDLDGAIADVRRSIELAPGPEGVDLRLTLGRLLSETGNEDAAEKELLATAKLVPDNPALQIEVVRGLLAANRAEAALPIVESVAAKLPDEVAVMINHARVLAAVGRLDGADGALSKFDRAMAKSPKLHGPHHYKVSALAGAGRCADAKKALAKFSKTKPAAEKLAKTKARADACKG